MTSAKSRAIRYLPSQDLLELVGIERLDHQRVAVLVLAGLDGLRVFGRPEPRRRHPRRGRHPVGGQLVEHGALGAGLADVEQVLLLERVAVVEQKLDGVVVAGEQHRPAQLVGLALPAGRQPALRLGAGAVGRQAARVARVRRRRARRAQQSDVDPRPAQAPDDRHRGHHAGAGEDRRRESHPPAFTSRSRISVATGTHPSRLW